MKRTTKATMGMAALICVTMTVGCSSKKQQNDPMALNAGVTDVSAVPPASVAPPAPTPTPVQPVVSDAPTQAPAPVAAAPAAAAGGKYTVQKGDTLWKIAAASYGDGKQWQKIAGANPGLSPSTLKAGQTIVIP